MKYRATIKQVGILREKTGCGLYECKEALEIFGGNIEKSYEFLWMRGQGLCRRKPSGEMWRKEDYINYIKDNF